MLAIGVIKTTAEHRDDSDSVDGRLCSLEPGCADEELHQTEELTRRERDEQQAAAAAKLWRAVAL